MGSLHECTDCGARVFTQSLTAGAFQVPPSIEHVHDDGNTFPMEVVDAEAGDVSNSGRGSA